MALTTGTYHGIEAVSAGVQVGLIAERPRGLTRYKVSGAQHGTSARSETAPEIATPPTTKANVATALQMISWGLEVIDYGNAQLDADGNFVKVAGEGDNRGDVGRVVAYAEARGWKKGDYKNLDTSVREQVARPARRRSASVWPSASRTSPTR